MIYIFISFYLFIIQFYIFPSNKFKKMDVIKIVNYNWVTNLGILKFDENYKSVSSEEKKNFWIPDNLAQSCFSCDMKFNLIFDRKHHCRICGNVFCNSCTNKQIHFNINDKKDINKLIKIRVCNYCFNTCLNFDIYMQKLVLKNTNKFEYFCKYYDTSTKNNENFLGITDKMKENEYLKYIINTYDIIIKNLIKNVLSEYFEDKVVKEWENIIYKLIILTVDNIRNSYLFLDDSLDINKYIKIKLVQYKDSSLCEVIPGLVIKTNYIPNYEKGKLINPKILLINLENNMIVKNMNDTPNSSQKYNSYFKIIEQRIKCYNPDIILIGKNYPNILKNNLKYNISFIDKYIFYDIKKKNFEQLARCTGNIILPSFNLIGNNNPFGKCNKFYVKNMKNYFLLIFEGRSPMLFNSIILSGKNIFFLKKLKMILKNILLPSARDIFLQKNLIYAFNMNINKKVDEEQICNILENNKKYRPTQLNEKNIYSNFELTMNKFNLNLNKNNINIKHKKHHSFDKRENILKNQYNIINTNNNKINNISNNNIIKINMNNNANNMNQSNNININSINNINNIKDNFYNGFDLFLICKKREYINYSLLKFSQTINDININNNNQIIANEINGNSSFDEGEIQEKMSKSCFDKIFISFFSDINHRDKTIFQYFYDFFKNSKHTCKICNEPYNKHLYQFYKIDSKLSIKFISEEEYNLGKVKNFMDKKGYLKPENLALLFNIYTYGYCNICNNIVTPLIRLNNEILNYSIGKLIRFFLENINIQNFNREYDFNIKELTPKKNCQHLINKNISRIFLTELGSCVIEYSPIIKYFIDPININIEEENNPNIDINNNLNLKNATYNLYNNDNSVLIEQYSTEAYNNSQIVLDILNELFNSQITSLKNLINKERLYLFNNSISSLINIIVMAMRLVQTFKDNIFKYMTKEYIQENDKDLYFLKYIIIIKKIYLKIIQIKSLSNKIGKYINKLNIISDILYQVIPYSYEENSKLNNKIGIPMELHKLENKKEYLNIISFIQYYNNRNFYDIEYREEDFGNIIGNTLSSDEYINFINKNNSSEDIKYTDIKCKRINNTILNEDEIKKNIAEKKNSMLYLDINDLFENSHKLFNINNDNQINNNKSNSNIFTKALENSSLLFNIQKNKFFLNNPDKLENNSFQNPEEENIKILEFLKSELLSTNKEEFSYNLSNNFSNILENYYIKKGLSSLSNEKSVEKNSNDLNNYFKNDEEDEHSENSEIINISKHINIFEHIDEDIHELNEDMTNIKNQLTDFNQAFIQSQRELNVLIKNSMNERKENNLSRNSSSANLFKKLRKSRKSSISSNGSNDSNGSRNSVNSFKSSEIEYREYGSKSFKLDSTSLKKLNESQNNENNNNNEEKKLIPEFSYMPEFIKIFELKKIKYLEDKIISKKYPEYEIKIYYPRQFQALRTLYFAENFQNFIFSTKNSENWEVSGGKSKANFFRSFDDKFIIKNISELEFNMLLDSAFNYFKHLSKFFFEKKPTLLAKTFGAFHIKVKTPKEKDKNYYLIYMENIYYNILSANNFDNFNCPESNLKVYDLKGSEINRYILSKDRKKGKILLDTNFLEDMGGEPLFLDFKNYQILKQSLINDCTFLKKEEIIDYSLLIIFEVNDKKDNKNFEIKKIRMGIIDYLRKYTWDKQIESYGKKLIHGFAKPTIINPEKYYERFIEKIDKYFTGI